jgi:hypothetical protein
MRDNTMRALVAGFVILSLLWLGLGCGKKGWPEPDIDEDRFVWSEISSEVTGRCMDITALLSGNVQNLARVTLEVEMRSEPCPGCPFSPTTTVRMEPGSENWERRGALVHVMWCGLEPDKAVRWRLIGHPLHASMDDVRSRVYSLDREETGGGETEGQMNGGIQPLQDPAHEETGDEGG